MPMSCFIDTNVPMKARTTLFGADPADRNINTFQAGYVLWRTDQQDEEDEGLLNSYIDRVTTDRKTAEPVRKSIVYFNADPGNRAPMIPRNRLAAVVFSTSCLWAQHGWQLRFLRCVRLQAAPLEAVREVSVDGLTPSNSNKSWADQSAQHPQKRVEGSAGELSPLTTSA